MTTEKTNRELVNAGFTFAKQISGLTPVNEIVKMIGDLATRLDVVSVRSNALAAENAVMLRLLTDISENHVEYFSEGEDGMFAGVPLDYVSEINAHVSRDVNAQNPFATTDAAIREIEARAMEEFAEQCDDNFGLVEPEDDEFFVLMAESARARAKRLRSGEMCNG
ncbi:hypothetical protein ACP3TC_07465 [Winslowiella sp. 2C04]|uniref:hypothetical protein n=1 Tax=Winslowiella sp. 2C04 TaxID=3416179 RepID=UPI003CEFA6C3